MGSPLPPLSAETFARRLRACAAAPLGAGATGGLPAGAEVALWAHYQELVRWNPRLSLIGPGTADEVVERHYGEALAGVRLLEGPPEASSESSPGSSPERSPGLSFPSGRSLLDVGSGGGFPGLVLAAAQPGLAVTLVEAKERKWAFLQAACRRARLSCTCLNARVGAAFGVGQSFDVVAWRALRLPEPALEALARITRRMLVWCGSESPPRPRGWRDGRVVKLAGSDERRIVEWLAIDISRPNLPTES